MMSETTALHATNHYRKNSDTYDKIQARLKDLRTRFTAAKTSEQVRMLQKSHSFAVISVQTPVEIHEEAFKQLWNGSNPHEALQDGALSSVNYRNNKADYIRHSLRNGHLWADVADMLVEGNTDKAHRFIIDNFKGVGPAKAPFTLAMLGFTDKACIDANVQNALDVEAPTTVVVEKYNSLVQEYMSKFPTLDSLLTPFLWQWVIFSYQRKGVSGKPDTHDVWFDVV